MIIYIHEGSHGEVTLSLRFQNNFGDQNGADELKIC